MSDTSSRPEFHLVPRKNLIESWQTIFQIQFSTYVMRQLATAGEIGHLQSMALGIHAGGSGQSSNPGGPDQQPPNQPKKEKKPPNMQRLVASKIAMLSSKNTEIMAWEAKITDSERVFLDLIFLWGMETGNMLCSTVHVI